MALMVNVGMLSFSDFVTNSQCRELVLWYLVVRIWCFHRCGLGSISGLRTEIPHQAAACHGQIIIIAVLLLLLVLLLPLLVVLVLVVVLVVVSSVAKLKIFSIPLRDPELGSLLLGV